MSVTEYSPAQIEHDLALAVRRSKTARARADQADGDRDEMIRVAHAAGIGLTRLTEITGLSKQRIDQIRRGARL